MKAFTALMLAASVCTLSSMPGEPKAKVTKTPQWSVLSLSIQKSEMSNPNYYDGTRVTALLHLPEQVIAGIDLSKSAVAIIDDTKLNLLQKNFDGKEDVIVDPRISRDGKACVLTFRTADVPTKNASSVHIRGNMEVVVVGVKEKTIEKKDVSLAKPIDFEVGTLKTTKSVFGRDNNLSFTGSRPVKEITVIDGEGKMIVYTFTRSGLSQKNNETFFASFQASGSKKLVLDRCTIRIVYLDEIERKTIPIDLAVRVGF